MKQDMNFTGERFVPELRGQIEAEHLHRYFIARQLSKGKVVLDIASGEGYGSALVSELAVKVIGVDIDKKAVDHASNRYKEHDIEFLQGSCESIPVDDAVIDVVVSFETIEHHDQHEKMMREINRVLKPEGILLISSPNKHEYSDVVNYTNPFHVKELYREEFESLLNRHFKYVDMLGQRMIYGSGIICDKDQRQFGLFYQETGDLYYSSKLTKPQYDIALASNAKLPKMENSIYERSVNDENIVIQIRQQLNNCNEQIISLNKVIADQNNESIRLNQIIVDQNEEVVCLKRTVEDQREETVLLKQVNEDITEETIRINFVIEEQKKETIRINRILSEQAQEVALLNDIIIERDKKIDDIVLTVLIRDEQISRQNLLYSAILNSKSWRITAGFRYIGRVPSYLIRKIQNLGTSNAVRYVFQILPLSAKNKSSVKHAAFRYAGWLFSNMPSYQIWSELRKDMKESSGGQNFTGKLADLSDENRKIIENNKRILVIDATTPTTDRDAGSVTIWFFLKAFIELSYHVTFIPNDLLPLGHYTDDLRALGVRCLTHDDIKSIEEYLLLEGINLDIVMLYRVHTARANLSLVKKYAPQAKIIFDTVDLHYLREERQARISKKAEDAECAMYTKQAEYEMMTCADATIVLSNTEREIIRQENPSLNVFNIPLLLDIPGCRTPYKERRDIVFIGGFLHQPNVDAIKYFVNEIWGVVRNRLPEINLLIIGANPPEEVVNLESSNERIKVVGFVEDLDEYFDRCRVSIAPIRFGAGIKGKIGTSASYGVPSVVSTVAAEGMGMKDGVEILIADSADDFAVKLVELYSNEALWSDLSKASLDYVQQNYSYNVGKEKISTLLNSLSYSKSNSHDKP